MFIRRHGIDTFGEDECIVCGRAVGNVQFPSQFRRFSTFFRARYRRFRLNVRNVREVSRGC